MRKIRVSKATVRRLVSKTRNDVADVFVLGGGFGPDQMIERRTLIPFHRKIEEAASEFERRPSKTNMIRLRDAATALSVKTPHAMDSMRLSSYLFKRLVTSGVTR